MVIFHEELNFNYTPIFGLSSSLTIGSVKNYLLFAFTYEDINRLYFNDI
ncbi:hypothetical protein DFQ02_106205 [Seonamhaeicola aphaedonensis]|uniref:Uncharacterized protein n=1 Tax=Seonamhaeicola aphaedonensis TaxID=1461338 RepID=A0A3D9HDN2_9FLAO|nr:hypothetical protein DFQ02_106205 [Seonamhaeicola aphaedonensis]